MITGLSHTGLIVRDMDGMIAFFRDTFGFQVVFDTLVSGPEAEAIVDFQVQRERIVVLSLGNAQIEMIAYQPAGRDYPEDFKSNDLFGTHLALVTDNMERDYHLLREQGIEIVSKGPQTIRPDHAIFGGTRVLYFRDPEGHPLELIQMPSGRI